MGIREAIQRYLNQRAADAADSSLSTWRYQLKLFAEWCEGVGIDEVGELRGYDVDDWYGLRADAVAPATLEGEMWTLKKFVEYLERREAVEDGLAEKVPIPNVDDEDRSNDVQLPTDRAMALLRYFRETSAVYGTRDHAFLELAWMTGARKGGLRALDLRDVHPDDNYVEFTHRPGTGTPLKNKSDGERPVGIPPSTSDVLKRYIDHHRLDVHDDTGRAPLLASMKGRPVGGTIQYWSHLATQPCLHTACPHDRERDTCEYTHRHHASKCPSSRSPHKIRTGSIGWQLDVGLPPWVVAERANATLEVIEQHYDKRTPRERMERRRRPFISNLELET